MVPFVKSPGQNIRGDGPAAAASFRLSGRFSPYSRGWSRSSSLDRPLGSILPVFAGMVPARSDDNAGKPDSPRIRGDGPELLYGYVWLIVFSPYSRGWSQHCACILDRLRILPVFAGMVPTRAERTRYKSYSPRIRGDGPTLTFVTWHTPSFSPYSRGWSRRRPRDRQRRRILPVFAGMVPRASTTQT